MTGANARLTNRGMHATHEDSMKDETPKSYVTTYCNKAHRMADGKPIAHECYVLPPKALEAERAGDTVTAVSLIAAAKPLRLMRKGVRHG